MKKTAIFCFVVLCLLIFLPSHISAQESSDDQPPVEPPWEITAADCPVNVPTSRQAECGYLVVPADYADPAGDMLRLPYILLRARRPNPEPDPLIFTVGGPGYSSLNSIWMFENWEMSDDRDVIVFEQRGNLHAQPNLVCHRSVWWDESEGNTACLDSILEKGIDPADYVSSNIAADIISLRQALGYEQWNLFGTSYSTRLMLMVMEMDPEGVRSAILMSVAPPHRSIFDHEADHIARSIRLMFDDCASIPECAAAFPDLETQFHELIDQLNQEPIDLVIKEFTTGEDVPLTVDGNLFLSWIVVNSFYQPAFPPAKTPYLPLMISETLDGNLAPLRAWVQDYWVGMVENENWAIGLLMAVNCQEIFNQADPSMSAQDTAASEWLGGFLTNAASREVCSAWGLAPVPPPAAEAISSEIPALVLAGSYDHVTPPVWSMETAEALPNSTYVEFPSAGHDVNSNNPCAQQMMVDFVRHPENELDDSCMASVPLASFVLPTELYLAPGIGPSAYELSIGDPQGIAWLEILITASILILMASLLALIIGGIYWLMRRRHTEPKISASALLAYLLDIVIVILLIAVPILLTSANNQDFGNGTQLMRSFGVVRDSGPATMIALVSPITLLIFIPFICLVLWAWIKHKWSLPLRLVTTIVVLAALPMIYLGVRWGLYTMML